MDDQYMEECEPQKEDSRRFTIYFQINDHEPINISDLKIKEYLKFKKNDEYALQYCQNYHTDENEVIINMYRSLDDVDYTQIEIPDIDMEAKRTEDVREIEPKSIGNASKATQQNIDSNKNEKMDISSGDASQASCNSNSQKSKCKIQPSPIWSHVEKVKNKDVYKCLYCKKEYKACGNTTNMLKHLKTQHPLFFQLPPKNTNSSDTKITKTTVKRDIQEVNNSEPILNPLKKQCADSSVNYGIKKAFKHINSFKEGGSMSDKITNAILFMICKDLLPISTVEHEGFLTLLKVLAPLYKPPSQKIMTKKLESRYDIMKQAFVKELQAADSYCITCDNWTDCSNKSYLGVTIHYLQKSCKMKSGCLGCFPLHERHTAEYLKQSLQQLLEEFNITMEKLAAIISDGEPAIKKACIELAGKDKHIICIAHVVAHLIPDALIKLTELTSIIDQLKSIVTLIRRSIPASDKLRELQLKAGKSEGTALNLIQDVPTRWTTKIDAIERYLELEQYVYVAMSECANPIDVLSREEIKILKDIFPMMEPIRDVITEISGDLYPTCSIIIPIVHCMEKKIDDVNPQTDIGNKFKEKIQAAISHRFKNFEHSSILSMTTILDPRFKKVHFNEPLAVYSAINRINAKLKAFKAFKPEMPKHLSEPPTKKSDSIWDFHDMLEVDQEPTSNPDSNILKNLELEQYLQLKRIPRKDDIFTYWKSVETTFPSLSKLALRQLSVIATTVAAERLFSKAGLIKRDNRNRLTGKHLNMLIFLSSLTLKDWCVF